jgi:hypothetical protein
MKLNQLENFEIDEAPLGFLKKTGLGIASKFGGRTARGQLKTGSAANELYNDYLEFVGQYANTFQSKKPTTDSLLAYLEKKGLDKREFAQLIDKELQAMAPAPEEEPERQEPTIDEPQAEPQAQNANDENNPLKPGNTSNIKTPGDIGNLDSDKTIPGSDKEIPTTTNTITTTTKRKKTGGREKGGLKMTPTAIYQRNRRKNKSGKGGQLELPLGNSMYSEEAQRYRKNFERIDWTLKEEQAYYNALEFMGVMEAEIPKQVLNKILNIAAEKMPADAPQAPQAQADQGQDTDQDQSSGGFGGATGKGKEEKPGKWDSFKQGFKQGMSGDGEEKKGTINYQKIGDFFPEVDSGKMRKALGKALQGQPLSVEENKLLAYAFAELVKKDPQETTKLMNVLKQYRQA